MLKQNAEKVAELAPKIMGAFHTVQRHHKDAVPITMRQFQALIVLESAERLSLTDFCHRLGLAASTGTELANRMIAMELIEKTPVEDKKQDRRQNLLSLTDLGQELLKKRHDSIVELFENLMVSYPEKDVIEFVYSFERIWDIIKRNRHK